MFSAAAAPRKAAASGESRNVSAPTVTSTRVGPWVSPATSGTPLAATPLARSALAGTPLARSTLVLSPVPTTPLVGSPLGGTAAPATAPIVGAAVAALAGTFVCLWSSPATAPSSSMIVTSQAR